MERTEDELWQNEGVRKGLPGTPPIEWPGVFDSTGRNLSLVDVLSRFWGWPKGAAKRAAPYLIERYRGSKVLVEVADGPRQTQQSDIIAADPAVISRLVDGLFVGASKESRANSARLRSLAVVFNDGAITDDGLTTGLIRALANRFDLAPSKMGDAIDFERIGTELWLHIDNEQLESNDDG